MWNNGIYIEQTSSDMAIDAILLVLHTFGKSKVSLAFN